jgi:DNA topoisomerase IB
MVPSKNGKSYTRLAVLQPVGSAAAAGLRYVSDAAPGIARQRAGTTFCYFAPDGKVIRDRATRADPLARRAAGVERRLDLPAS